MQLSKWLLCGTLSVLSILITIDADADAFYQDKTIRFIVGFSPGGGYDAYTRIIARHIGRHIPGNPDTIVQNMAGASSMLAAN